MSPSPLRHPARLAGASLLRLQSDERLAELAGSGHEAAFDAIVDRYRTPLTRYCSGIVGPNRAEDAVQQALINAHEALQRTDEVRHLRSWMYRIAHNSALNVLRAVRDDVSLDDASAALPEAGSAGPVEAFERSERFQATVAALRELPERQRAALVLRELEGRSHEEIAATLGVSTGAARQHLMRARTAMRAAVTAITPYPLIVRLADALAGGGGAGWTDAAVGVGTGATLAKLTAGVVATGALVGGAVGTERVVHHHRHVAPAAAAERPAKSAAKSPAPARETIALPATPSGGSGGGGTASAAPATEERKQRASKRRDRDRDHRRKRSRHHGAAGSGSGSSHDAGSGSDGPHGHDGHRDASRHDDTTSGRDRDRDASDHAGSGDTTSGRDRDASGRSGDDGTTSHRGRRGSDGDARTPTVTTTTTATPTATTPEPTATTAEPTATTPSADSGSGSSGSGSSGGSGRRGGSDDG